MGFVTPTETARDLLYHSVSDTGLEYKDAAELRILLPSSDKIKRED